MAGLVVGFMHFCLSLSLYIVLVVGFALGWAASWNTWLTLVPFLILSFPTSLILLFDFGDVFANLLLMLALLVPASGVWGWCGGKLLIRK